MANNPYFQSIQQTIAKYDSLFDGYEIEEAVLKSWELDSKIPFLFEAVHSAATKAIHPLFIKRYGEKSMHFQDKPIKTVGLDVETNAKTGEPMLFGFAEDGYYTFIHKPTLAQFFESVESVSNSGSHLVTWGKFDIQVIIRLFNPNEKERSYISRGLSANVKQRIFPCMREMGNSLFYIANYFPGRSLKLGISNGNIHKTIWVFNISQFFPGTIEQTAKATNYRWLTYDKDTHIVDWERYNCEYNYRKAVQNSNKQDANAVQTFSQQIQQTFHRTFNAYPKLLVSHGSLTDAAVSKLLSEGDEYQANSFNWLARNVWNDKPIEVRFLEVLLAECFSAGYVDQFGIGYYDRVCTADIASAYPAVIRQLPDLRYSELILGNDDETLKQVIATRDIETVIFRGLVTIPDSLKFHPITVKTDSRENFRPVGTFEASYILEERKFCQRYGATFANEHWCAIVLRQRKRAPIAEVSEKLGKMRDDILAKRDKLVKDSPEYKFLDGQQFVVKVIDNSLYGKTVMMTEIIENIEGNAEITGYSTGDRFNLLYGTLITARTRTKMAEAMMALVKAGSKPIMAMTDSIYWSGRIEDLPTEYIAPIKTAGYFEVPKQVTEFYILKTGQYEYIDPKDGWQYKLRGLPIESEFINGRFLPLESKQGKVSLLRKAVKEQTRNQLTFKHPKNVYVRLNTKRLHTIGQREIAKVGLIELIPTDIKPFVLSGKQVEKYIFDWPLAIDGYLWLKTPKIFPEEASDNQMVFKFLREEYELKIDEREFIQKESLKQYRKKHGMMAYWKKKLFVWKAVLETDLPPPKAWEKIGYGKLESYFCVTRKELGL